MEIQLLKTQVQGALSHQLTVFLFPTSDKEESHHLLIDGSAFKTSIITHKLQLLEFVSGLQSRVQQINFIFNKELCPQ